MGMNNKLALFVGTVLGVSFAAWWMTVWLGGCSSTVETATSTLASITSTTSTLPEASTTLPISTTTSNTTNTTAVTTTSLSTTTTVPIAHWEALGEGVSLEASPINARVWALAKDNDGNVYAGGLFDLAGGS